MTQPNQSELDAELLRLQAEFDMDEYGTVNENGVYLMKRVWQLITQQTTAARMSELEMFKSIPLQKVSREVAAHISRRYVKLQKGDNHEARR